MKTKEQRDLEAQRKREAAERLAKETHDCVEILKRYNLFVVHLRDDTPYGTPTQEILTYWSGGDITVLSVEMKIGRLFTVARVNKKAGDTFSRRKGWEVGASRLLTELQELEMRGPPPKGEPRRWGDFYWMAEQPGRETILYASMVAASAILGTHRDRKAGKTF